MSAPASVLGGGSDNSEVEVGMVTEVADGFDFREVEEGFVLDMDVEEAEIVAEDWARLARLFALVLAEKVEGGDLARKNGFGVLKVKPGFLPRRTFSEGVGEAAPVRSVSASVELPEKYLCGFFGRLLEALRNTDNR